MEQPDDFALVIGVNDYPRYRPLKGAISDAEEFYTWLIDKETGGGLPEANCRLICSSADPLRPVLEDISDVLDEFHARIDQAMQANPAYRPRRFYFYFSGHGQSSESDEVNLCLSRWGPNTSRLAVSARKCWDYIARCLGVREVIVFLDCCRVEVAGAAGIETGNTCPMPLPDAGRARALRLFATEYLRQSFEGANGGPAPGGPPAAGGEEPEVRGYFTKALLQGLRGAAEVRPEGGVSLKALKEYVVAETSRLALKDRKMQTPLPLSEFLDEEAVIFGNVQPAQLEVIPVAQPAPQPAAGEILLTVHFTPGRAGPVVLVLPSGDEVVCPDLMQDWQLQLGKGLHLLEDRGTDPVEKLDFRLTEARDVAF